MDPNWQHLFYRQCFLFLLVIFTKKKFLRTEVVRLESPFVNCAHQQDPLMCQENASSAAQQSSSSLERVLMGKSFQCADCGKSFTKRCSQENHSIQQSYLYRDPNDMDEEMGDKTLLNKRARMHEKNYECPVCQKKFLKYDTLKRHHWRQHPAPAILAQEGDGAWGGSGRSPNRPEFSHNRQGGMGVNN